MTFTTPVPPRLDALPLPRRLIGDLHAVARDAAAGRPQRCLFSGPSGTGKTLAAEALARTLNRPLHHVGLATLGGRFIGETEKNLRSVLAKADAQGAVLLFDEADALFGKRTAVQDGANRYANQEVSYLLSRAKPHRGLVILASEGLGGAAATGGWSRVLFFGYKRPWPRAARR